MYHIKETILGEWVSKHLYIRSHTWVHVYTISIIYSIHRYFLILKEHWMYLCLQLHLHLYLHPHPPVLSSGVLWHPLYTIMFTFTKKFCCTTTPFLKYLSCSSAGPVEQWTPTAAHGGSSRTDCIGKSIGTTLSSHCVVTPK